MIGNVLSNAKVFLKERTPWKKAACAKGKWHNILPTQELEYIRIGSYFTKKKTKTHFIWFTIIGYTAH